MTGADAAWPTLLASDPRPWLRESDEPYARWVCRVRLDDRPPEDPTARADHAATLNDSAVAGLIDRLPAWTGAIQLPLPGQQDPQPLGQGCLNQPTADTTESPVR